MIFRYGEYRSRAVRLVSGIKAQGRVGAEGPAPPVRAERRGRDAEGLAGVARAATSRQPFCTRKLMVPEAFTKSTTIVQAPTAPAVVATEPDFPACDSA